MKIREYRQTLAIAPHRLKVSGRKPPSSRFLVLLTRLICPGFGVLHIICFQSISQSITERRPIGVDDFEFGRDLILTMLRLRIRSVEDVLSDGVHIPDAHVWPSWSVSKTALRLDTSYRATAEFRSRVVDEGVEVSFPRVFPASVIGMHRNAGPRHGDPHPSIRYWRSDKAFNHDIALPHVSQLPPPNPSQPSPLPCLSTRWSTASP